MFSAKLQRGRKLFKLFFCKNWYLNGAEGSETELYASYLLVYLVVQKQVCTDRTVGTGVDGHKHMCYFFPSKDWSRIVCI